MASRPKGYGFSREVQDKLNAKYDRGEEAIVTEWIKDRTGLAMEGEGPEALKEFLFDGQVLCTLINGFEAPGVSIKPNKTSHMNKTSPMRSAKECENVEMFLTACEKLDMKKHDLFQVVDLRDSQNLAQVVSTLKSLGSKGQEKNLPGAWIGPKMSQENRRDFDEDQLRAGRNVIGLQMGTNQVASQKGMTGYGQGRQIIHKTN